MSNAQACPRCGTLAEEFLPIEPGMRVALQEAGEANVPDRVCSACYEQLSSSVSQGLKLRMERDMREKNKMVMWKNRVHLIKNARGLMTHKAYSEAAVQYEKYLRVLEVVYNLKKGELAPAVFNNSSRSKELTVIASVYWDMLRIYDTSPRYTDRMQHSAEKLAMFLPFSPIYPDILKKAELFAKGAKNKPVMRNFLKLTKSRRGPCFIATAAYAEQPLAVELHIFRRYRDEVLRQRPLGRYVIYAYYRCSPPLARALRKSKIGQRWTCKVLTKVAGHLQKSLKTRTRIDGLSL
jgi:hypothetical protein